MRPLLESPIGDPLSATPTLNIIQKRNCTLICFYTLPWVVQEGPYCPGAIATLVIHIPLFLSRLVIIRSLDYAS